MKVTAKLNKVINGTLKYNGVSPDVLGVYL